MPKQIIIQPDDKYAIWSTNIDDFIFVNASEEEIVEELIDYERFRITKEVSNIIKALKGGEKPYYQFTRTFAECVDTIKDLHGEDSESLLKIGRLY